ncbi:MAG: hypothetical protein LBG59_08900 [Candidatus Peribacteria bacterium]|nr:hypothetical protein [Candidatus Peribacteria bacterium]
MACGSGCDGSRKKAHTIKANTKQNRGYSFFAKKQVKIKEKRKCCTIPKDFFSEYKSICLFLLTGAAFWRIKTN